MKHLKIQVLKSGAGYYVGQLDEDGCPYSRLSEKYWVSREAAALALKTAFACRYWGENEQLVFSLLKGKKLECVSGWVSTHLMVKVTPEG